MAGRRLLNEDNKFADINKSKLTKTQVFDMNAETLTEKNIDDDGIETTTVKKTPASYFDNQTFMSDNMDLSFTAPAGDKTHLENRDFSHMSDDEVHEAAAVGQEWKDAVFNLLGVGNAIASEEYIPPSETPVPSGVYESEYFDDVNGYFDRPIDPKQEIASYFQADENKLFDPSEFTVPKYILNSFGAFIPNPEYREGDEWIDNRYPNTEEGKFNAQIARTPYEDVQIILKALEKDIDTPITAESFVAEKERQNTLKKISSNNLTPLLEDKDGNLISSNNLPGEPSTEILADTSELLDNLDESAEKYSSPSKPHDGELNYNVEAAVQEIVNQDPTAIEELNNFATWAEGVSDEESQAAAKEYLDELAVQPSVNDRFKKAMAIAFAAMLFGDDIGTAMNTGFGVVADDYAREDLEQEAINTANAKAVEDQNKAARDLAKTIATEERALGRALKKEERDLIKQLELEKRTLNKTLNAEGRSTELWADKLIITTDIAHQKLLAELDRTASKETLAEAKRLTTDNYAFIKDRADNKWASLSPKAQEKFDNNNNFRMQMDGGLGWMVRNSTKVVDFENNVDQRNAFENSYAKWMHDSQRFDAPNFDTYIQDEFIKNKFMGAGEILNEKTYIEPSLISPTLESLRKDGWSGENIQWSKSHEQVANLYEKVQQIIPTIGTEKHTLMLLKKDFNDFKNFDSEGNKVPDKDGKKQNSKRYNTLAKKSAQNGIGVFTRFVNQMSPASLWGMVYDPAGKGKSVKWKQDATAQYLLPTTE